MNNREDRGNHRLGRSRAPGGHRLGLGVSRLVAEHWLVRDGRVAGDLYREAIARLGRTRLRPELVRAHRLYGEWLRRKSRRAEAGDQQRVAHQQFTTMGRDGFRERVARELLATGERIRRRTVETRDDLTP